MISHFGRKTEHVKVSVACCVCFNTLIDGKKCNCQICPRLFELQTKQVTSAELCELICNLITSKLCFKSRFRTKIPRNRGLKNYLGHLMCICECKLAESHLEEMNSNSTWKFYAQE